MNVLTWCQSRTIHLSLLLVFLGWCLTGTSVSVAESSIQKLDRFRRDTDAYNREQDYFNEKTPDSYRQFVDHNMRDITDEEIAASRRKNRAAPKPPNYFKGISGLDPKNPINRYAPDSKGVERDTGKVRVKIKNIQRDIANLHKLEDKATSQGGTLADIHPDFPAVLEALENEYFEYLAERKRINDREKSFLPVDKPPLARAKVYLAAGDYRRAVEACQMNVDQSPSVESYVHLIYVYHALDGYLEWLAKRDEWVKVGQLALSMVDRGTLDLVDPPGLLDRMAKELLHEGVRQQYDLVAGLANRLDKPRVNQLWLEVQAWKKTHPENWWAGVPEQWQW